MSLLPTVNGPARAGATMFKAAQLAGEGLGGLETVTKKFGLLRFALLCIALGEVYDIYGDCAWVADLATTWSPYLVSIEESLYKTQGRYGAASDFTTHYTLNSDGMLGLDCTLGSYSRYTSDVTTGKTDCEYSYYTSEAHNTSEATVGARICTKGRLFFDEAKLNAYLASIVPGATYGVYQYQDGVYSSTTYHSSATVYDVRPNKLTGFFDNSSTVYAQLGCGTSQTVSLANGTMLSCAAIADSTSTRAYIDVTVPMLAFVRPDAMDNIRDRAQCDTLNGLYLGTLVIFALTCVLILGKFTKHAPGVVTHLRHCGTSGQTEVASVELKGRAVSLAECPLLSCLAVPLLMTKQQIECVREADEDEAEHTLWARLFGTHQKDALLTARYSAGTLLGKASLVDDSRCGALDITSIVLFVIMVPFSRQGNTLLYGWSRNLSILKWIFGFPIILMGLMCAFTVQMCSLMSISVLIVSFPLLAVISIAFYGDQKITLRLIEDIPQLIITAVFVARIERNTAAAVSIAGNVLMLMLQTSKDLFYSFKYARKRSTTKASAKQNSMEKSRSSLAALKTQLSAPESCTFHSDASFTHQSAPRLCCADTCCTPSCYPNRATVDDMIALSRLQHGSYNYEEDPCACTAYPTCGEQPCSCCGHPCAANYKGDACLCCGHPCCIPGVKPWSSKLLSSSYADLTLRELLHLSFVTPWYMMMALMPPFLFVTLWRLHRRRVLQEDAKVDSDAT